MFNEEIKYLEKTCVENKRVLLRVDFNVSITDRLTIADDFRIKQSLPTINYLLKDKNKLILISHLDRPQGREERYSLKIVASHLQKLLRDYQVKLVDDFLSKAGQKQVARQRENEILILENIRFYPQEKRNTLQFAKRIAELGSVYINDAFGVSHRPDASIVGVPRLMPSYAGLLLKKEVETISKALKNPKKPLVVIIGGAKISTKINFINKLMEKADYLLIGGGLANTFFCSQGYEIGKSFCEYERVENARKILFLAAQKNTAMILPSDVVIGDPKNNKSSGEVKKIDGINNNDNSILDIGPETQAKFGAIINKAKTIIWNGPVGYIENPVFRRGTDFIYYAITQNQDILSIVGGGDTLAAISKKEYLDKITHISTGGGAMLEFIEKGTLPGIEVLRKRR